MVIAATQLVVFREELKFAQQRLPPPPTIASLVITRQPFPLVIAKPRAGDITVCLSLLIGAAQTLSPQGGTVRIIPVPLLKQQKLQPSIEVASTAYPSSNSVLVTLKTTGGTRKSAVALRFSLTVPYERSSITFETSPSEPFIIITNECQLEESEGNLLQNILFRTEEQVPWVYCANALQREFVSITRQNVEAPERGLSVYELSYIHQRFFHTQPFVTPTSCATFWDWFGKFVQKIRYQKHLLSMWKEGYIVGFISREDCNELLSGYDPGCFIIRFSERNPGLFAVAYKLADTEQDRSVRHFLVRANELEAKKTLPDLLSKYSEFVSIIKINANSSGLISYEKQQKHMALSQFYSKSEAISDNISDYDVTVVNTLHLLSLIDSEHDSMPSQKSSHGLSVTPKSMTPSQLAQRPTNSPIQEKQTKTDISLSELSREPSNERSPPISDAHDAALSSDDFSELSEKLSRLQDQFSQAPQPQNKAPPPVFTSLSNTYNGSHSLQSENFVLTTQSANTQQLNKTVIGVEKAQDIPRHLTDIQNAVTWLKNSRTSSSSMPAKQAPTQAQIESQILSHFQGQL
jgi:hypothetical protein